MYYVSPNFTHEKLNSGKFEDLVDIFEDRMSCWLLNPSLKLLEIDHGYVPAIAVALGYFEGIEVYCSGEDSICSSKVFFKRGFQRVFKAENEALPIFERIVDAIYVQLRCGFAHDGLFRNRVFFNESRAEALTVTWPKANGSFIASGDLESVVVNPRRFIECIDLHFKEYSSDLRKQESTMLRENFLKAVDMKWGINDQERVIGMSRNEFFGKA